MNVEAMKAWDAAMALDARQRAKLLERLVKSLAPERAEVGRVSDSELLRRAESMGDARKLRSMREVMDNARRSLRKRR